MGLQIHIPWECLTARTLTHECKVQSANLNVTAFGPSAVMIWTVLAAASDFSIVSLLRNEQSAHFQPVGGQLHAFEST